MTITTQAPPARAEHLPTGWLPTATVPSQAGQGVRQAERPAPRPVSLRELGVDPRDLGMPVTERFGMRPAPLAAAQPLATQAPVLRAGRTQCLAVAHLLAAADVDLPRVAQVIDTDPVLTLRTLHLANADVAPGAEADTVERALVLLGARAINALVNDLLLTARMDVMEHLWLILARALATEALSGDPAGYTAGLLSGLAEQLGVPVEVVAHTAGVSAAVVEAVCLPTGPVGTALTAVLAHERSDQLGVVRAGFAPVDVYDAYLRAFNDAMATVYAVGPA